MKMSTQTNTKKYSPLTFRKYMLHHGENARLTTQIFENVYSID